jgi:hypothetical protein
MRVIGRMTMMMSSRTTHVRTSIVKLSGISETTKSKLGDGQNPFQIRHCFQE